MRKPLLAALALAITAALVPAITANAAAASGGAGPTADEIEPGAW